MFRILPERREFLEGLLKADGVTFHTPGYARAFADCVQRFLGATIEASGELVQYHGHHTRLTARPIGVDFRTLSDLAWKTPGVEGGTGALRPRLGVRPDLRIGLGVDRLDYSKGLLKRLWALDAFFNRYPKYRGRFTFVQIAVPTRNEIEAYHRYREVIRETVSDINGRYRLDRQLGKPGWQPIEYLEGRIGLPTLVAHYRAAELVLVSSVYDGMNLVAKEYVACQVDETGVLLVSQMAGAADELTDALIINPYDLEGVADAIRHALEMPVEERQRRMRRMRAHLAAHDIYAWVEDCLADAGMTALCAHSLWGADEPRPCETGWRPSHPSARPYVSISMEFSRRSSNARPLLVSAWRLADRWWMPCASSQVRARMAAAPLTVQVSRSSRATRSNARVKRESGSAQGTWT